MKTRMFIFALAASFSLFLCLCLSGSANASGESSSASSGFVLKPYDNLYNYTHSLAAYTLEPNQFKPEDIYTYGFDSEVSFMGSEAIANEVMEAGKNPGLGVWDLHALGITGEGVNVAVIDQTLLLEHPEYAGRIVAYYDSGTDVFMGSMHGSSVVSILAGETLGVAPGANVYYAAIPSMKKDAAYFADCLQWIIEQNNALPEGEKIRLVSVSSGPENGSFINSDLWNAAVAVAEREGMMVLDCRSGAATGFVFSSYYDRDFPDDVTRCLPGYPGGKFVCKPAIFGIDKWKRTIFAPASFRTTARAYYEGDYRYGYDGLGGQSWAVPYVSGVLALGWQVNPDLDATTMKELLFRSSWIDADGGHFINPPEFINLVRNAK